MDTEEEAKGEELEEAREEPRKWVSTMCKSVAQGKLSCSAIFKFTIVQPATIVAL